MLEEYTKPPLSFEAQLDHLVSGGLIVKDKSAAIFALSSINYYRLSAYWFPFRVRDSQGEATNRFVFATTFENVLGLYDFDRQLRLLVLDAIERIEVAIRTQLAYHMAHKYGPFVHMEASYFHEKFKHHEWITRIKAETTRASDEFIRHYKRKYNGFPTIPIWMLTEIMTLGALSRFYEGLKNDQKAGIEDKKAIASHFNIHHKKLADWLHVLTYIRNVCAHHSRLWNRELDIKPDKVGDEKWMPPITPRNDRVFYILLILRYLLASIGTGDQWARDVTRLLIPIADNTAHRMAMGMPNNWTHHPIWRCPISK